MHTFKACISGDESKSVLIDIKSRSSQPFTFWQLNYDITLESFSWIFLSLCSWI